MNANEVLDYIPTKEKEAVSISELSLITEERCESLTRKVKQLRKYRFIHGITVGHTEVFWKDKEKE